MIKFGKKQKAKNAGTTTDAQAGPIDPHHGLIPVIKETCSKGARFTITAESEDQRYVLLVDRGGPFNANGPGVTGSAALAAAVRLRQGTYHVEHGWPVAQPLFQIGLDTTLQDLSISGPGARGPVVSLPVVSPSPIVPAAPAVAVSPAPAPTPPVQRYSPPVAAPIAPMARPAAEPTVAFMDRMVAPALPVEPSAPAPIIPGMPGASQQQGPIKHYLTQALLWVVQVDEPDAYTLGQAWRMARQAVEVGVHDLWLATKEFWTRELGNRWRRVRHDWKKSGETARKRTGRTR